MSQIVKGGERGYRKKFCGQVTDYECTRNLLHGFRKAVMWTLRFLLKIMVLPMIILVAVARLGVSIAIKLYGFANFRL